jgi:hypothetical protein
MGFAISVHTGVHTGVRLATKRHLLLATREAVRVRWRHLAGWAQSRPLVKVTLAAQV